MLSPNFRADRTLTYSYFNRLIMITVYPVLYFNKTLKQRKNDRKL